MPDHPDAPAGGHRRVSYDPPLQELVEEECSCDADADHYEDGTPSDGPAFADECLASRRHVTREEYDAVRAAADLGEAAAKSAAHAQAVRDTAILERDAVREDRKKAQVALNAAEVKLAEVREYADQLAETKGETPIADAAVGWKLRQILDADGTADTQDT